MTEILQHCFDHHVVYSVANGPQMTWTYTCKRKDLTADDQVRIRDRLATKHAVRPEVVDIVDIPHCDRRVQERWERPPN
jgi:hypothetical protein